MTKIFLCWLPELDFGSEIWPIRGQSGVWPCDSVSGRRHSIRGRRPLPPSRRAYPFTCLCNHKSLQLAVLLRWDHTANRRLMAPHCGRHTHTHTHTRTHTHTHTHTRIQHSACFLLSHSLFLLMSVPPLQMLANYTHSHTTFLLGTGSVEFLAPPSHHVWSPVNQSEGPPPVLKVQTRISSTCVLKRQAMTCCFLICLLWGKERREGDRSEGKERRSLKEFEEIEEGEEGEDRCGRKRKRLKRKWERGRKGKERKGCR